MLLIFVIESGLGRIGRRFSVTKSQRMFLIFMIESGLGWTGTCFSVTKSQRMLLRDPQMWAILIRRAVIGWNSTDTYLAPFVAVRQYSRSLPSIADDFITRLSSQCGTAASYYSSSIALLDANFKSIANTCKVLKLSSWLRRGGQESS
jgi:hypothetical protein